MLYQHLLGEPDAVSRELLCGCYAGQGVTRTRSD